MKTKKTIGFSAILIILILVIITLMPSTKVGLQSSLDKGIEQKIDSLLERMTLEEKIGQMTQLTIDALGQTVDGEFKIDQKKLREAIVQYKVGSFLNAPVSGALTREKWHEIIGQLQELSLTHIGIPTLYGLDQNHGTTYTLGGTMFPQNINLGASFNRDLAFRSAQVTAYETRASDCPWTFSPTVDMARDPRWSRVWENFGEDCLVNAVMGSAMVEGFQGEDRNHLSAQNIGATVKHYMGYSMAHSGKDRTPAYISDQDLREKCFAPYKACIEAGALSVMVNSSSINALPVHANKELLTRWLKEDLNWDGMLVTDWSDINNLYIREQIARDKKEAISIAINAGIDMCMEPYKVDFCVLLKELVLEGKVPMERIDDATRRILRLKYRLGLFDRPNTPQEDYPLFGGKEHALLALEACEESEVLLKNKNNILPLKPGVRMLVTGPNANSMRCLNGGWSYSWQGNITDIHAGQYNTIYEALRNKFGEQNVILEEGVRYKPYGDYRGEYADRIPQAKQAARHVDVIVACIGENSYCETPGNLLDLDISENQQRLVRELATTGKPIILILNEGRPRLIKDLVPLSEAVVDILLPGNYGGDALANILSGDANPSAKMPYTYPLNPADLTTYDYRVSEETDQMEGAYNYEAAISVQWPFGYGLSYTTFEYDHFACDRTTFTADDMLRFEVTVTNTGKRRGKEAVMLFSRDMTASLVPENRRLRSFTKIDLAPGESRVVTLTIPASDLAFVGADGHWVLEEGRFQMQCGDQIFNIDCTQTKRWETPNK